MSADEPERSLFDRCVSRRSVLASAGALTGVFLAGCGDGGGDRAGPQGTVGYFGWVFNRPDMTAIGVEVEPATGGSSTRRLRAYVCDGMGGPGGLALWFTGEVDVARLASVGEGVDLRSASGQEQLRVGYVSDDEVRGVLTTSDGRRGRFVAHPAAAGAGIYQVVVDGNLRFTGTSVDGSKLEGGYTDDATFVGTITTPDGQRIAVTRINVALASSAQRAEFGYSDTHAQYAAQAKVPGEFVAVISPNASHWFGRDGNVRGGRPGSAIIGLDMAD